LRRSCVVSCEKIQREPKSLYLTAFSALLISCGYAENARKKLKKRQESAYLSLKRRIHKREKSAENPQKHGIFSTFVAEAVGFEPTSP
jgi:hypothetical protein